MSLFLEVASPKFLAALSLLLAGLTLSLSLTALCPSLFNRQTWFVQKYDPSTRLALRVRSITRAACGSLSSAMILISLRNAIHSGRSWRVRVCVLLWPCTRRVWAVTKRQLYTHRYTMLSPVQKPTVRPARPLPNAMRTFMARCGPERAGRPPCL